MNGPLYLFREHKESYQLVGSISSVENGFGFSYAPEYLMHTEANAISFGLPLQEASFSPAQTNIFFRGLLPRGGLFELFTSASRINTQDYPHLLAHFGNETVGALIFSHKEELDAVSSYNAFNQEQLQNFALQPKYNALTAAQASQSLPPGSRAKIGLYHQGDDPFAGWLLPQGLASSTHFIKASGEVFSYRNTTERFCLLVAEQCGLEVVQNFLVPFSTVEPLLVTQRFDRSLSDEPKKALEELLPRRLHQENFCQALGMPLSLKYESGDEQYLKRAAHIIDRAVSNPLRDKLLFFDRLLFNYLIGNCNDHLGNYSLLWSTDWSTCSLAPLQSTSCTTMYPAFSRNMSISLCKSGHIDNVSSKDIRQAAQTIGFSEKIGWERYRFFCEKLPTAIKNAENTLREEGFAKSSDVAKALLEDAHPRLSHTA